MMAGSVLDRVSYINDLGVVMDEKINFSENVDVMVGKAFAMLGFIRRLSFEFLHSLHVLGLSEAGVRQLCMVPF
jgi:hypothetical protein